jgi:hypothetical protein
VHLKSDDRVHQYEIVNRVGEGGMGVVYKAHDRTLDRPVALKFLLASGPADADRLRREARALAALNHPNIVTIYEIGEFDDTPFLALEWMGGGMLADRRGRPLPITEFERLLFPVARALAADPAGTGIAMLSIRLGDSYPLILERRFDNALSMPHLWFAGLEEGPAAASLWARVASDIGARRPGVVVVRAPGAGERGAGDIDFDYLRRLCGTPGAPAALSRYGLASHVSGYDIFRRDFKGAPACASS